MLYTIAVRKSSLGKIPPWGLGLGARVRNPSNPNPSNPNPSNPNPSNPNPSDPNPSNPNPSNPNPKTQGGRFLGGLCTRGHISGGTIPKTTQSWPSLSFSGGITEFTLTPETVAKWVLNRPFHVKFSASVKKMSSFLLN